MVAGRLGMVVVDVVVDTVAEDEGLDTALWKMRVDHGWMMV